jgi:hypothetical protein
MTLRKSSRNQSRGQGCRADQITEHDRELAALSGVSGERIARLRGGGLRFCAIFGAQGSNGIEQGATVTYDGHTHVFQVVRRQV